VARGGQVGQPLAREIGANTILAMVGRVPTLDAALEPSTSSLWLSG
jgi:hypothetical protein